MNDIYARVALSPDLRNIKIECPRDIAEDGFLVPIRPVVDLETMTLLLHRRDSRLITTIFDKGADLGIAYAL